mmetsp:Transcript_11510/g.31851  ORF Transcript_11510/g.31851 Transcript_11510/m.31851 type:complete len:286 (-) Transcript_11510:654-1511(-)
MTGVVFSRVCAEKIIIIIYSRKYLEPLPVRTTFPEDISPDAIGLVVTRSPLEKALDPEIKPVMEPSRFFFHFWIVGTPLGAFLGAGAGATFLGAAFLGAAFLGAGLGLTCGAGAAFLGATTTGAGAGSSLPPPPRPNNENVFCLGSFSRAASIFLGSAFLGAGLGAAFFLRGAFFLGAGAAFFLGAGATFFGAAFLGATFFGAAFLGAGATFFGAGPSSPPPRPKRENVFFCGSFSRASSIFCESRSLASRVRVIVAPGSAPNRLFNAPESSPPWADLGGASERK